MVDFAESHEEWLKNILTCHTVSHHIIRFRRIFLILDPNSLKVCLTNWAESLRSMTGGLVIALDGKTIRHSFDSWSGKKSIHMVSAWVTELGISLACEKVDSKSNEIPTALEMLEKLSIEAA